MWNKHPCASCLDVTRGTRVLTESCLKLMQIPTVASWKNPPSTHPFVDGYPHSSPLPAYCIILILYMACNTVNCIYFHIFQLPTMIAMLNCCFFSRHVLPRPSASRKTGRTNLAPPPWSAPWPLGDLGSDGLGLGICPRAEDRFLSSPVDERMWNAQTESRPWWDEIRKGLGKKRLWNLKVVPNHQNYRRGSVSPTWWNMLCICIYIYIYSYNTHTHTHIYIYI